MSFVEMSVLNNYICILNVTLLQRQNTQTPHDIKSAYNTYITILHIYSHPGHTHIYDTPIQH